MPPALQTAPALLSATQLSGIATRATGLFEGAAPPLTTDATREPEARALLAAWADAFALGDGDALRRRLSWDGWDERRALAALTNPGVPASEWPAWLNPFLAECGAAARLDAAERDAAIAALGLAPEPPFVEVWWALARAGERALAADPEGEAIEAGARRDLERALVVELAAAGELTLFARFTTFLARRAPAAGGSAYAAFVREQLEGGLADTFESYPVLARQLATLASTWLASSRELLARLRQDRDALAAAFGLAPLGALAGVTTGLSDRHDGGRRVLRLRFASGAQVVYKPRDVGLEAAFEGFLRGLAERGLDVPPPMQVLERQGYGWAPWLSPGAFEQRADVARYYRRAGALLAVLHVLRGADAHRENVVAAASGPVLIDAEMLLQPEFAGEQAPAGRPDLATDDVTRSCLSSSLLTLVDVDADGGAHDVGGLMASDTGGAAAEERVWHGLRTDALGFAVARATRAPGQNQVRWRGVEQRPQAFASELRAGFADAYRFLHGERARLAHPDGPLAAFRGRRSRLLFRPSDQYGLYLQALCHPRHQRRGLERSLALERLNRVFRHAPQRPVLWPLVAEEQRALEAFDVPRYALPVDAGVLQGAGGEPVSGHLRRSGLEATRAGLQDLGESDLARQLARLDAALEEPRPVADGGAAPEGVAAAVALGDAILERFRPDTGPVDLYGGRAGVALFMAALARLTAEARFAAAAHAVFRSIADTPAASRDALPLGACRGRGSLVYASVVASRLLGAPEWTALALRIAREIAREALAADTELDVAGGAAGALLAFVALHETEREPWLRERIDDCVARLLETQRPTGRGAAWPGLEGRAYSGFAHGSAGIAHALGRARAVTGDARIDAAVARARVYERALYSPTEANWPAHAEGGAPALLAWCHGAPGIGIARALAFEGFDDAFAAAEIQAAARATAAAAPTRADHLCCGTLGRSEALLVMGRRTADAAAIAASRVLAGRVARRIHAEGRFGARCDGFEHRHHEPGFFRGLAGIGYQLLRHAAPSRLPSVLAFESRAEAEA